MNFPIPNDFFFFSERQKEYYVVIIHIEDYCRTKYILTVHHVLSVCLLFVKGSPYPYHTRDIII